MADARAVETGQFSTLGSPQQPDPSFIGYFEPAASDRRSSSGRLYLVADGLGSAGSSALAGQFTLRKILHDFYHDSEPDPEKRLLSVVQKANTALFERNQRFPTRRPLSITLVAALIHDNKLAAARVGDSQVYVVWDQDIEPLTATPPEQPPEPAAATRPSPSRSRLPDGLGLQEHVAIETFSRRLFAGDNVVLTGGGLTGYITETELAQTVSQFSPQEVGPRLAALAAKRGSREVISVSVTRLLADETASAQPAPTLPAQPDWEKLTQPLPGPPSSVEPPRSKSQPLNIPVRPARPRWLRPLLVMGFLAVIGGLGWAMYPYWSPAGRPSELTTATVVSYQVEITPALAAEQGSSPIQPTAAGEPTATLIASGNSPLPTPAGASAGDVISATQTVSPPGTPTPTPTPLPTLALPAGCTNKGRFSSDVTVRDGQEFPAGAEFEKVWAVVNYGTCPWGPGYTLRFVEGDRMDGETQNIITLVKAEETGEISLPLVAPPAEGSYRATWQLYDQAGEPFGPELFIEIAVVPGALPPLDETELTVLYDFVQNAAQADWQADGTAYQVKQAPIDDSLIIPFPEGIVTVGQAEFGGGYDAPGAVLLTHPHQELGLIEGTYAIDFPVQPEDVLIATLGLPRAAIINDDGVTFEVVFKPEAGPEQVVLSKLVTYDDSPVMVRQQLTGIEPEQTGSFILRVKGGASLSYDWAVWIDLRLARL
ncbi:MAG: NBR1-Ig-like domain-containing protein [Chloroflexota bacterium]